MARSKFDRWTRRLGIPNQHNGRIPRDFWLEDWEKAKILAFHALYPLEGYRRLAYMMLDADIVAVSPSTVYRVLKAAGRLAPRGGAPSRKGKGFVKLQPTTVPDSRDRFTAGQLTSRDHDIYHTGCGHRSHQCGLSRGQRMPRNPRFLKAESVGEGEVPGTPRLRPLPP
jgi:hypothetical protein